MHSAITWLAYAGSYLRIVCFCQPEGKLEEREKKKKASHGFILFSSHLYPPDQWQFLAMIGIQYMMPYCE